MLSPQYIASENERYARRAAREHRAPYIPYSVDEINGWGITHSIPFANLGDYYPRGWELVEDLLVDKGQFSLTDSGGWALSIEAFKKYAREHYDADGETYGYSLHSEGQFQIYVAVWKRIDPHKRGSRAKPRPIR